MREERRELITISVPGFASNDEERRALCAYESVVSASSGVFTDMGLNRVLMGLTRLFRHSHWHQPMLHRSPHPQRFWRFNRVS